MNLIAWEPSQSFSSVYRVPVQKYWTSTSRSPVRAFVEINFHKPPTSSVVQRLLLQAENARRHFGGEIVPILVTGGEPWRTSPEARKLRVAGYFITHLQASTTDTQSASHCAKEIRNFLVHLPYRFKGVEIPYGFGVEIPTDISEVRLRNMDHINNGALHLEGIFTPASQIFNDVLISLKSILSPEQFEILETELSAFSEEYRHEHYTACALRIGRTLEHVVYALARDWGVNVNRSTLHILSDLGKQFDQLSNAAIAFATTDENHKTKRMKTIQNQLGALQIKLVQLAFDLHSELVPEKTDVPLNVESIVRDIRKQFGSRNKVVDAVNSIINEGILRKILHVRNDAAHASTSGVRREVSKLEIDAALELLRTALFLFSNVAFAVAEKNE